MGFDNANRSLFDATHDRFDFFGVEFPVHGRISAEIGKENGGLSTFALTGGSLEHFLAGGTLMYRRYADVF
jgi:hypothetical protein